MKYEAVIEILENEKECVQRANICDRECQVCDLVRHDEEILEALNIAIDIIKDKIERSKYTSELEYMIAEKKRLDALATSHPEVYEG